LKLTTYTFSSAFRIRILLILAVTALYWGLTAVALDRYPALWLDEGWIAEAAWTRAEGGPLGNPSHGTAFRLHERIYWNSPLYFLVLGTAYATGVDPWLGGRALSVLAGYLTLLLLAHWVFSMPAPGEPRGPTMSGARIVAVVGLALLFTLDPFLWKSHRTIRFEAFTGLWTVGAVVAAVFLPRRWRGFAVGLLGGLAVLNHPNGVLGFAAAAGVVLLLEPTWPGRFRQAAVGLGVFLLTLSPWILYLAEDRRFDFANVVGQNLPQFQEGADRAFYSQILREWRRYARYFALPYLAVPLVLWAAVVAGGIRRRGPATVLFPLAVWAAGLACLHKKTEFYLTSLAPYVFLLAAWLSLRIRLRWSLLLGGLWIALLLGADAALLYRNRSCDHPRWVEPLTEAIPEGASVAGSYLTWFSLRDHPYFDYTRRLAGDIYDGRADYVIWGDRLWAEPRFEGLRRELGPLLEAHADRVAETGSSACYGTAVVYRPRWDEVPEGAARALSRYGGIR